MKKTLKKDYNHKERLLLNPPELINVKIDLKRRDLKHRVEI